jgi:hypothetical protein
LERVVLWVSRLALPAITYLLGQVLYWLWFDNLDVDNHVGVLIGGLSLSVVLLLVLVLTLTSWCLVRGRWVGGDAWFGRNTSG